MADCPRIAILRKPGGDIHRTEPRDSRREPAVHAVGQNDMPRLFPIWTVIATLRSAIAPAQGEEPWRYQIASYFWAADLNGDVATLPGVSAASVNASFAFMLAGETHNGRIGLFADIFSVDIKVTDSVPGPLYSTARLESKTVFATAAGFWRLWSDERASLDAMAGARFWSVDTELTLSAGIMTAKTVSYDESWVDPLIGFKARGTLGGNRFLSVGNSPLGR